MFWKRIKIEQLHPSKLKNMIEKGKNMIILDVRTNREWAETGVIPNSLMVPSFRLEKELNRGLNLDKGKPVIVVCRSGRRSQLVAKKLKTRGIEVYNLKHGIVGWISQNFEIEKI